MIDKIKAFLANVKGAILYVVGPILAVVGYIFYLRTKNDTLTNQLAGEQAKETLATVVANKEEKDDAANKAEGDYASIRNAFIAEQTSTSTGTTTTDDTKPQT